MNIESVFQKIQNRRIFLDLFRISLGERLSMHPIRRPEFASTITNDRPYSLESFKKTGVSSDSHDIQFSYCFMNISFFSL